MHVCSLPKSEFLSWSCIPPYGRHPFLLNSTASNLSWYGSLQKKENVSSWRQLILIIYSIYSWSLRKKSDFFVALHLALVWKGCFLSFQVSACFPLERAFVNFETGCLHLIIQDLYALCCFLLPAGRIERFTSLSVFQLLRSHPVWTEENKKCQRKEVMK